MLWTLVFISFLGQHPEFTTLGDFESMTVCFQAREDVLKPYRIGSTESLVPGIQAVCVPNELNE